MASESPEGPLLRFLFMSDGIRQYATATLEGDCLVVEYNLDMLLSDFADGTFCRS